MYKIGEFSILSKTTIKALRYYEEQELLKPKLVDFKTGYRYYDAEQLIDLSKIISLRQIGISIKDIKKVLNNDISFLELISKRKMQVENDLSIYCNQLSKINYILEGKKMNNEVFVKELPEYTIYYEEGIIKDFSQIVGFIFKTAEDCKAINPDIKCISPDYCYVSYLDGEYKEKDIRVRYCRAVESEGIESDLIKFEKLKPVKAVCIYHKGSYSNMRATYSFIMQYVKDNNYQIIEPPRERYIDGMWNKENEEDWLTEIQVPIA